MGTPTENGEGRLHLTYTPDVNSDEAYHKGEEKKNNDRGKTLTETTEYGLPKGFFGGGGGGGKRGHTPN